MVEWFRRKGSAIIAARFNFQGRFIYRLIWLGMICACIPVILAGTVYYQISVENAHQKTMDEVLVSLAFAMDRVERILAEVELESLQLAMKREVSDTVTQPYFGQKYIPQKKLLNSLQNRLNANEFVGEIILYESHGDSLISTDYGLVNINQYYFKTDRDYFMQLSSAQAQWMYLPEASKHGYVSFVRRLPIMSQDHWDGLIAFHVQVELLKSYMYEGISPFPETKLLLLHPDGELIFSLGDIASSNEVRSNDKNLERIMAEEQKSGVFFAEGIENREMLYVYQKASSGRIYTSLIPEEHISRQVEWIRWVTVWTIILFVAVGILLSILNSIWVYSPIQQLIKQGRKLSLGRVKTNRNEIGYIHDCLNYLNRESESLSTYLKRMEPNLRERVIHNILENRYAERSLLLEDCTELKIPVDANYMVLVVEVENIHKEERFLPQDKAIVGFIVTNVMEELLDKKQNLDGYVLHTSEGNGIAVVTGKDMTKLVKESHQYAFSIHEAMGQYLKFKVAIGIGSVYTHIADIAVSYQEALISLQYRLFRDSDSILYIDDLENPRRRVLSLYPRKEDDAINEALSRGDLPSAIQSMRDFSQFVRQSQSYQFINQSYMMLLSSILRSVEQRGCNISELLECNWFDQLRERKTTTEICHWFTDICFLRVIKTLEQTCQTQTEKSKADILRVCEYIHENIRSDISLTQCAELLSMTPAYVSKLFKKVMGVSFVEYVVNCKVEEAKKLLLDTEYSITEIASIIGYSERNLNRVFHRYTHFTPGQFRSCYR